MNRKRAIAVVLLMIFILSSILPIGYAATTENMTLDSAMYAAIKRNLQQQGIQASYNDEQYTISISNDEMARIRELTLSNSSITNLSGLEKFSNVTSLDLSSNALTDDSNLAILSGLNLNFLDLSSNGISDVSAITNLKNIQTVNLHNQNVEKVEVVVNSMAAQGIYQYSCELPQIVKEYAKPIKADWINFEYEGNNSLRFDIGSFNSNSDTIGLTIGSGGTRYTGRASLKMKITNDDHRLYNSEFNIHFVVINENQRAIFLKDEKLYKAVKEQLELNQTFNSDLQEYTNSKKLYDIAYNKQQILVINEDDLINKISSLKLSQKQISDLSGLEGFVGLEKDLDVSSNYIKTIDTIVELQKKKEEEEVKLQERFKTRASQLQEEINALEVLQNELKTVIKTYNEAVEKYNSYADVENKEEGKTEKLQEQQKILDEQGKRYTQLTGNAVSGITKLDENVNITGGEIAKAEKRVEDKEDEVYNLYKQIYKLTSVITPELKNITDDEFNKLTLEKAKTLLQAQAAKMTSIEANLTKQEKNYLTSHMKITFDNEGEKDEKKAPVAEYYTQLLKDLETRPQPNVDLYKNALTELRKFDAFVMINSAYCIDGAQMTKNEDLEVTTATDLKITLTGQGVQNIKYLNNGTWVTFPSSFNIFTVTSIGYYLPISYEKNGSTHYTSLMLDGRSLKGFCIDGVNNTFENYQKYPKTLDSEDTRYIEDAYAECVDYTKDDRLKLFKRIVASSDEEIKEYVTLPRLYKLNMSENLIENIDQISVQKELRELRMANNEIVNINNVDWAAISRINTLDLSFNNISDIKILETVSRLKDINLSKNLVSGSLNFQISDKIQKLDLSENQINDIEDLKNQFEFKAKAANLSINDYIQRYVINKINLKSQELSMSLTIQKTGDRVKVNLPKIFSQFEELDGQNTSFGISSWYGNASSDGKYVILETPVVGNRTAVVSVVGTKSIGLGTTCTIQYAITDGTNKPGDGDNDNQEEDKNNIQITINTNAGSSVQALKTVNNMSYVIVGKGTKVEELLTDITLNTEEYKIVVKDANIENQVSDAEDVKTNQAIVVDGLSNDAQCKIVVKGDVTGTGSTQMGDILKLNQYRLDKIELTDAEILAGNVAGSDEEINMSDILKLNQYRLNKISEL